MALPTQIGKYEIVSVLGRGGMGIVYHARDKLLGRSVALKVMSSELAADSEIQVRFLREARSVASLQHPNIVVVHELGEHDGSPFIAMEFLEGQPLDRLLRDRTPLTLMEKIDIVLAVARALQYAHHKGVVHRDVKPANIMHLADGSVKVVDFGIAHLSDQTITRTGSVLGTLAYLAPEQLNGEGVDHRTDVFSLGVVLYQLLSGKLPFEGATTAETMMKILMAPPPPLTSIENVDPPELQPIVDKALAKKKEDRYQSCADLMESLTRLRRKFEQQSQVTSSEPRQPVAPPQPAKSAIAATSKPRPLSPRDFSQLTIISDAPTAVSPAPTVNIPLPIPAGVHTPPALPPLPPQDPPARRRSLLPAIYISAALLILVSAVLLWYQSRPDQGPETKGSDSRIGTTPTPPEAPHSSAESGTKTDDSTGPVVPARPETGEIAPAEHSHRDTKSIAHNAPAQDAVRVALTEGALHMDKGEYQEAIRTYQNALRMEPSNVELKQKIRAAQTAWEVEQRILKK